MPTITRSLIHGSEAILLEDEHNKVEILPSCGAILNAWHVKHDGEWVNVIKGYDDAEQFRTQCESLGFRSCKLSPFVCRMRNGTYTYNGQQMHIEKFGFDEHKIHGIVYDLSYEVVHETADASAVSVELETCYTASDKGFPFVYTIMIIYTLGPHNNLTLETRILNQYHEPIPICDGWHPYFRLGGPINDLRLQMATDTMLEFDASLMPTGKLLPYDRFKEPTLIDDTFLDNSFLLKSPGSGPACTLTNEKNGLRLSITPDASYPILQVYTPDDRESIAIENLSAAPDAFNNGMGLIMLGPEETATFSTTYTIGTDRSTAS